MKKTILIFAVAAMSLAACSKEEVSTTGKVMTISAEVDDDVKATISDNGDKTWTFKWTSGDGVFVKDPDGSTYKFTWVEGNKFEGMATPKSGTWTAVFPYSAGTADINFTGQNGMKNNAMAKYVLAGSCKSDESSVLSVKMEPKFAVLKIKNQTGSDVKKLAFWLGSGTKPYIAAYSYRFNQYTSYTDFYDVLGTYQIDSFQEGYYVVAPAGVEYAIEYKVGDETRRTLSRPVEAGHIYNVTLK